MLLARLFFKSSLRSFITEFIKMVFMCKQSVIGGTSAFQADWTGSIPVVCSKYFSHISPFIIYFKRLYVTPITIRLWIIRLAAWKDTHFLISSKGVYSTMNRTNNSIMEVFSARIRRLRLDLDETPSEVAKGAEISVSAILAYEDGSQQPKMDSLVKIATYFNVSVDYLTGRTDLRRLPSSSDFQYLQKKLEDISFLSCKIRSEMSLRDEI